MLHSVFIKKGSIPFYGGKSIEVKEVKYLKFGIEIELDHKISFGHSKPVKVFIPYENIELVEKYEGTRI